MDILNSLFQAGTTITPWIPINAGVYADLRFFQIEWQTQTGGGGAMQVDYLATDGSIVLGGAVPGALAGGVGTATAGGAVTSAVAVPNSATAVRMSATVNNNSSVRGTLRGFTSGAALGVPVIGAQGQGYFFGGFGANFVSTSGVAAAALVASPNEVRVMQMVLDAAISVGHVSATVVTTQAANFGSFGIYDKDGNLLLDSGQMSTAAGATITKTLGSAVVLQPGVYYFAWSATSLTPTFNGLPFAATGSAILNAFKARYGVAANALASAALPATLGTVTASATIATVPLVLFEV